MLEALTILILVIVGAVLIIVILGYGIYITFYPLTKTIKGGIDAMKEHAEETKKVEEKKYARTPTDRVRRARKEEHKGAQKRGHKPKK
ncbi:MAG: hypothetical protein A2Y65_11260 [Deltaproteobacteria bacterium RBG_13_52_11]|nr:MAG: hypothetical protein A2Y65_11260 [Deltaproteobacteria bacterium RBG_13_52_11]